MNGNNGGRPFTNVFYVKTDSPGIDSSAGIVDLLTAFESALSASTILNVLSNTVHVTQFQGVLQTGPSTAIVGQKASTLSGGSSGTITPANTAVVLSWLSSAYWRGGKPRTYLPGIPYASIDDNHSLVDADKAALVTRAGTWRTGVNAITTAAVDECTMGFVSFQSGKAWRSPALFFPFSGVTVHDRLASQRRRLGPWLS